MSEQQKINLCEEYWKLAGLADRARNADNPRLADSYERSMARIEDQLQRHDVDPNDYR